MTMAQTAVVMTKFTADIAFNISVPNMWLKDWIRASLSNWEMVSWANNCMRNYRHLPVGRKEWLYFHHTDAFKAERGKIILKNLFPFSSGVHFQVSILIQCPVINNQYQSFIFKVLSKITLTTKFFPLMNFVSSWKNSTLWFHFEILYRIPNIPAFQPKQYFTLSLFALIEKCQSGTYYKFIGFLPLTNNQPACDYLL